MTTSDLPSAASGPELLEAVYYSAPAPRSMRSLAYLGLVFDRLIFPAVHVPITGIDVEATTKEIERLRQIPPLETDDTHAIQLMILALNAKYLKDFCVFTGTDTGMGILEPGADALTHEIELAVFGPPRPNFFPIISLGFSRGLPGSGEGINSPSWLSYPANALLYAARTRTVLVNDAPEFPVPQPTASPKANAAHLSTVLALEAVRLALPTIRQLSFLELAEFREETRDCIRPFRRAMLKLSKDLNQAITSDMSLEDVRREAAFLIQAEVLPNLEELREELARPSRPWYKRMADVAQEVPEMVGAFATMPPNLAIAKTLSRTLKILVDVRDAQLEKEGIGKRGGFHYLLKLTDLRS